MLTLLFSLVDRHVFAGFQVDTEEGISFLPGFVDAIVGLERGETRSFELTFPDTWQQEALRGVKGLFMVNKIFICSFYI